MRDDTVCRGDDYETMIRECADLQLRAFNDKCEFDIDVQPGVIFESLQAWNTEVFEEKLTIAVQEKEGKPRNIVITVPDQANVACEETQEGVQAAPADDIFIKVKFFKSVDDPEGRTRVRFHRKRGDLIEWTRMFGEIKKTHLNDVLLLPREHMEQE